MKYDLVGVDGNAFAIMGHVKRAMVLEGMSKHDIDNYLEDAQSSDYEHLICVSLDIIDKLNERKR